MSKALLIYFGPQKKFMSCSSFHQYNCGDGDGCAQSEFGPIDNWFADAVNYLKGDQYLMRTESEDTLIDDLDENKVKELGVEVIRFKEQPSSRTAYLMIDYLTKNNFAYLILETGTIEAPL